MEREKSMHVLSKDKNILPQRKPSVPWMKQCLYGDVTDNWLSVLKNPNDNMDIVEYKILEWFESHDLLKPFVILKKKLSKLRKILDLIFIQGRQHLLCYEIEHLLDTSGIAVEIDKTIKKLTTNRRSDMVYYQSEKMKNKTQMIEQILKLPVFQKINQTYEEEPLFKRGFPQYKYIMQQPYPQARYQTILDFNKGVHGVWKHKSIGCFITWTVRKVESVSVESFNAYEQCLKNYHNEKDISAASYSLSKTMTAELSGVESVSASCTKATGKTILLMLSFDDVGELEDTVTFLSIHPDSLSHNEFVIMTFVDIHYVLREGSYTANLVNNIHKWQEQNPLVFDESEIYSEGGESLSDDGTHLAENTGSHFDSASSNEESESTEELSDGERSTNSDDFYDASNHPHGIETSEVGDSDSDGMHEFSASHTPRRYVSDGDEDSAQAVEDKSVAVRTLEGGMEHFLALIQNADLDANTAKLPGKQETTPDEEDTNAPKGRNRRNTPKKRKKKK
jgi:hypothetical protein